MKKNRFVPAQNPMDRDAILWIEDYNWWTQNEKDIVLWMDDHLPRGRDHQQGIVLSLIHI